MLHYNSCLTNVNKLDHSFLAKFRPSLEQTARKSSSSSSRRRHHHHHHHHHHHLFAQDIVYNNNTSLSTGSTQHCGTVLIWDPFLDTFVHHLNRLLLLLLLLQLLLLLMMMLTSRCRCLLRPHGHCSASRNSQSSREAIEHDWMTFDILLNAVTTKLIVLARKTLYERHMTAELPTHSPCSHYSVGVLEDTSLASMTV